MFVILRLHFILKQRKSLISLKILRGGRRGLKPKTLPLKMTPIKGLGKPMENNVAELQWIHKVKEMFRRKFLFLFGV
jgi:hypothetical protein